MLLLASFVVTHYGLLREHWARHSRLANRGVLGSDRSIGRNVDLGGCLTIIDWSTKRIVDVVRLEGPTGFVQHPDGVLVAQWRANRISVLNKSLDVVGSFGHPLLNDPHTLSGGPDRLIIANTGLDAILALEPTGGLLWAWMAVDHGYTKDQLGRPRHIDRNIDHRSIDYPTLHQTTHLNSAVEDPEDPRLLYATLFHQGSVIRIDRRTNRPTKMDSGLKHCHSLRPFKDGYSLCDTQGGRLIIYDRNLRRTALVPFDGQWIADAFPLPNGRFLVLDANLHMIVEIGVDGTVHASMTLDPEWKGFQLEPLLHANSCPS